MSNNIGRKKNGGFGGPMGGIKPIGEKAKDFKGTLKKILDYLKPYRISIIVVLIFAIGSSAFSIIGPKILGKATTKLFEGLLSKISGEAGAGIDFTYIGNILIILILLYAVSAIFAFIQGFIMSGIAQKVSYNLRKEISLKINKIPLKYFDKMTHGEVLSRVTNDVDTINTTLNQSLSQVVTSMTTLIGVVIMMLSISVTMTLAALLIVPLSGLFISFVIKKSQKYFKEQQSYLGHVNGHVEEIYSGHNIMKAFNGEEKAIEEFNELNDTLYNSAWKSQFLSGMMMPIMNFIGNLGYVAVTILGGYLTVKNYIKVGDIQSFIQYIRSFNQPIAQAAQIANVLQSTAAAAERVFEFLEEKEEISDFVNTRSIEEIKGEVTFKDVHFGYNEDKVIINNFSSTIRSGQRVAIVGPTGAGKTTIVKLLMRFYELNSGEILLDNYNIKDFNRSDLRKIFGMVLQDTWLFNGSIMENIRYGNLEASDEEVIKASKAAHVHHFVKTLPDGYNMELNEDATNVSQGQKQLLTIARAILADPKILILDEATSSVDTRTEVLIQKAMDNLMKGRTSFIIAHRLSTIRDADLILVMNEGDIVEQGTHKELLNKKGFYASLYNSQFENSHVS
ncbi:MAG: ABC transporter ATP-binding protein [Clostridium sp.]|uniref:ABC transporter ATP-binding protein n=1 Tax=Clostridium sp. TaxID=1506 RepID=UPI0025B7B7DC|nr:ABC transporter ATP-binding protein [Clostridium sp.]MCF0147683.1 ABC transporter ATP-binding protein [Clostridium sp.]